MDKTIGYNDDTIDYSEMRTALAKWIKGGKSLRHQAWFVKNALSAVIREVGTKESVPLADEIWDWAKPPPGGLE